MRNIKGPRKKKEKEQEGKKKKSVRERERERGEKRAAGGEQSPLNIYK